MNSRAGLPRIARRNGLSAAAGPRAARGAPFPHPNAGGEDDGRHREDRGGALNTADTADRFRAAVERRDAAAFEELFADDIRFYSPVKFTPFEGKPMVLGLFGVLLRTFEEFRYVGRTAGDVATSADGTPAPAEVLVFRATVRGKEIHGIDLLNFAPDGRLWENEMGPKGGDELNLIEKGRNYGWPIVSNGDDYNGDPIPDHPTHAEFAAPKLWWNPSISPAGLIFYTGSMFPQWKGSAFLGALSGTALIRVTVKGDSAQKADQWDMGTRIRDVAQGPDGALWVLEDGDRGAGGQLFRLTPRQ